jgi:transposase
MKPPLYIRHVTDEERAALEAGLRSHDAFTVRRCQIVLASAERQKPAGIAKTLRCAPQTVRNVLHAFEARGLACVQRGSNVPITVEPVLNAAKREQLRAILHQSPRTFGQPASVWTLKRLAEVCHEQGLSDTTLSCPTTLDAIVRLGVSWQRAKHWIVSPDPAYERKKTPGPPDPHGRQPSGPGAGLRR